MMMSKLPEQNSDERRDALAAKLAALCERAENMRFTRPDLSLLDALQSRDLGVNAAATSHIHKLGDEVQVIAKEDRRFPGDAVRMIRTNNGSMGFYPHFFGTALVRRALRDSDPTSAIDWMQKIFATKSAGGKTFQVLWGAPVEQEIQLTPNIKLSPIELLPDSPQKSSLSGAEYYQSISPTGGGLNMHPPESALVMNNTIEPFVYDPDAPPADDDEFIKGDQLLHDIALVLTIVGPRAVIPGIQWFTFNDPDFNEASMVAGGRVWKGMEVLPLRAPDYPPVNDEKAKSVVAAFVALGEDEKHIFRVALKRLNQAMRRSSSGDSAVELSIVLESLMGEEGKRNVKSRLAAKAAEVIGDTDVGKRRIRKIFQHLYQFRNDMVHTGVVDEAREFVIDGSTISCRQMIDIGAGHCADLIFRNIESRSNPG